MSAIKSDQYVKDVCRPGTVECCRYLCMGSMGWECAKHTSLQPVIDARANSGQMRATGDNCDGPPSVEQTVRGYSECDICGRVVPSLCEDTDHCEFYPHSE